MRYVEKICTDTLEWIGRVHWLHWWHSWVAWCIPCTGGAHGAVVDHIRSQVGPVEARGCPLKLSSGTGMSSMEVVKHILPQGSWYDWSVMQHHYGPDSDQRLSAREEVNYLVVPVLLLV